MVIFLPEQIKVALCISFSKFVCTFFRSMKGFSHRGMGLGAWSMGHGVAAEHLKP